jgi:hypothetical protein
MTDVNLQLLYNLKLQEVTKLTKQSLMEEALSEQMKERAEMERKLHKLSKTMDHLERAKREEERPLIEDAHRNRLQDDEKFYKEQQEVMFQLQLALRQSTFPFMSCWKARLTRYVSIVSAASN